nr:MAG: hypothetical protein [Caudoviricetes sp.]
MALKTSNKNRKKIETKIKEVRKFDLSEDKLKKILISICLVMLIVIII